MATFNDTFARSLLITLDGPLLEIDPVAQGLMCLQRARDCVWAARAARIRGETDNALRWLKSAEMLRITAAFWRMRTANERWEVP